MGRFQRGFRRLHSSFLPIQNMQGNNQPDHRLPPRLFATDRFPSGRLNIYSKPDLLAFIRHTLRDTEELDYIRRSCFGKLFDLPARQCPVSWKLIHAMLTRQLVVEDKHTLWSVFGSDPIKFGLQEFGTITGLPCGAFPVGYTTDKEDQSQAHKDPYWIELIGKKRFTTIADLRRKLETDKHMPGPQKLRLALIIIVPYNSLQVRLLQQLPTPTSRAYTLDNNLSHGNPLHMLGARHSRLLEEQKLAFITPHLASGIQAISKRGDCGPVTVKFLEMHTHGDPDPDMSSITDRKVDDIRKQYALDIYKTFHMEILMHMLGARHSRLLEEQKLAFITPHLASGIQAISKSFNKSRKRETFLWDDQLTDLVLQPGRRWMEDVFTVYTPMIWADKH
ncbi:hypothetical protein F2Q69_00058342 [Brassica cretica]|uniref:DUF1985 domain-containing protein n=1 Tax=Brassica cretica TaxID=69181 RepID=A0A8S9RJK6_BRACR|nr:hypothetical protein F2Q69_00058342 [Brassica cretica]